MEPTAPRVILTKLANNEQTTTHWPINKKNNDDLDRIDKHMQATINQKIPKRLQQSANKFANLENEHKINNYQTPQHESTTNARTPSNKNQLNKDLRTMLNRFRYKTRRAKACARDWCIQLDVVAQQS